MWRSPCLSVFSRPSRLLLEKERNRRGLWARGERRAPESRNGDNSKVEVVVKSKDKREIWTEEKSGREFCRPPRSAKPPSSPIREDGNHWEALH